MPSCENKGWPKSISANVQPKDHMSKAGGKTSGAQQELNATVSNCDHPPSRSLFPKKADTPQIGQFANLVIFETISNWQASSLHANSQCREETLSLGTSEESILQDCTPPWASSVSERIAFEQPSACSLTRLEPRLLVPAGTSRSFLTMWTSKNVIRCSPQLWHGLHVEFVDTA